MTASDGETPKTADLPPDDNALSDAGHVAKVSWCGLDLFDFALVEHVMNDGPGARVQIRAKALIDPTHGWLTDRNKWAPDSTIDWAVPGPWDGPFSSYHKPLHRDPEWPGPERIPVAVTFIPDDAYEITRFRKGAENEGWDHELIADISGWLELRDSQWRGEPRDAFPFVGRKGGVRWRPRRCYEESLEAHGGACLPIVVELDADRLAINADALGRIWLVLGSESFKRLRDRVAAEQGNLTAQWSGQTNFREGECAAVISGTDVLALHVGNATEGRDRMREEWELGVVFREAREVWHHELPPCPTWEERTLWRRSEVHRALRRMLPGIAEQARLEAWTDTQRKEAMDQVLRITLECRFAVWPFPAQGEDDTKLSQRACEAAAAGQDPTITFWPLYELGIGNNYLPSRRALYFPRTDFFREIASRYERIPGMWSPPISRAVAHALLLTETRAPWRRIRALVVTRAALLALGILLGTWIAGVKGAVLGMLVGGWLAHRTAVTGGEGDVFRSRNLARKMQLAVLSLASPNVCWEEVAQRMRAAAKAGAVWPPEAWRLVDNARRQELASRTDW